MNIGLLIRGAKAGIKLAKSGAKAATGKAKSGAKAATKAVGKNKVVRGASRVGGKVAEGIGYAATPGLRKAGGRYFKKKGTGPIKSISKAAVRKTGKKVVGGSAAIGTGYGTTKTVKSKRAKAAEEKAKRDAAAEKARKEVNSENKVAKPNAVKKPIEKPIKKALPAYAQLSSPKPTKKKNSRAMTPFQRNRLRGDRRKLGNRVVR